MNPMEFYEQLTDIDDELILDAEHIFPSRKKRSRHRLVLVAALVSLMIVTAFAAARGRAEIVVTPGDAGSVVTFHNLDIWPVEESDWYPQDLPEGYTEKWISSYEEHVRSVTFVNDADGKMMLTYGPARYMPSFTMDDSTGGVFLRVGKHEGRSFSAVTEQMRYVNGKTDVVPVYEDWLFWVDGERKLGFVLRYRGFEQMDLGSIAESVIQVETLEATYQNAADAAVVKLGDYRPGWIPEGYEYVITYGNSANPLMNTDVPGYVHRVYRNEQHYAVQLFYEYIPVCGSAMAGDVIGIGADLAEESIDLNGTEATYYETPWGAAYAVVWQRQDVEGVPLTFTLYSDGISTTESIQKDDLIRMAESVTMITPADTAHFERKRGK